METIGGTANVLRENVVPCVGWGEKKRMRERGGGGKLILRENRLKEGEVDGPEK